ncbi:hypothetical protein HN873_001937 [Arachis hypogaea]
MSSIPVPNPKNEASVTAGVNEGVCGTVPDLSGVCPLTLLLCEIWERVASRVASSSIQDLFNMQATCKLFLDTGRSSAVYKVASMAEIPVVFGYDLEDRPKDGFLYVSARAGNPGAIFRIGMREFCWMGRHVAGVDTLLEAADAGDVQARYMCAMLLLTPGVGDGADAGRGVEMFENVLATGKIEMCREFFGQLFANPLIGVHPSDPGKPVVCMSSVCPTRGTMGATNDSTTVSCVHCLAEFEVFGLGGLVNPLFGGPDERHIRTDAYHRIQTFRWSHA